MEKHSNFNEDLQILTSFPNFNNKHIDYVIVYEVINENEFKDLEKVKIRKKRDEFFMQLIVESFEIYNIKIDYENKNFIYALLHCPTVRLLEEAEAMRLEMRLRNVTSSLS